MGCKRGIYFFIKLENPMGRFLFLLSLFFSRALIATDDITGFWKTVNEKGESQCIIAVYEYDDVCYGRIVGTFGDNGVINDSIYHPTKRAPGVVGEPFYSGLDIIWGLVDVGVKYKGKILDPEKGNVYNSELWPDDGNLIVRGKYLMFGRSYTWLPATESDFSEKFKKPDLTAFVPKIPEVK
jgi:uncharacterized protein (DUF2147 family)